MKNTTKLLIQIGKWLVLSLLIGFFSGSLSAFFLWSLEKVTAIRLSNPWIILGLPFFGMTVTYCYQVVGKNAQKGNNLIIEQGNGGSEAIPLRMIPLTLFGTIGTHLFGGSVGREGTAVQMGGAVSEWIGKLLRLDGEYRKIVIICGISGGFSSVFGTPLAGTVFSLEVLGLGKMKLQGLLPSLLTGFFANYVAKSYGTGHTHYLIGEIPEGSLFLGLKIVIASCVFGLVSLLFSRSIHLVKEYYSNWIPNPVWRTGVGALIIIILVAFFQTTRYLGLSLPLLTSAFKGEQLPFDFLGKLLFTVFSLGAGFQGGEVTPLFEIGATLGATLAPILMLPVGFLAALGFISVFSGAANTPLACFVMGIELFGYNGAIWMLLACVVSYMCSGNKGIYSSQKINKGKYSLFKRNVTTL